MAPAVDQARGKGRKELHSNGLDFPRLESDELPGIGIWFLKKFLFQTPSRNQGHPGVLFKWWQRNSLPKDWDQVPFQMRVFQSFITTSEGKGSVKEKLDFRKP